MTLEQTDTDDLVVFDGEPADVDQAPVTPQDTPAAASSPLTGLRQRRAAAVRRSKLDLIVPGYEPPVYVRFRALEPAEIERITARHAKAKATERALRINSTVLATACVGVFEVDADGTEVSVDPDDRDGEWLKFDQRLAAILGVQAETAADVVQELWVEKMHVLSAGDEVVQWSTGRDSELRRAEQGD